MQIIDQNGNGFHYKIFWRKAGLGWVRPWNKQFINNAEQDHFDLEIESATKWEIKIVAANYVGESKAKSVVINI